MSAFMQSVKYRYIVDNKIYYNNNFSTNNELIKYHINYEEISGN